jgi:hypothetical protein
MENITINDILYTVLTFTIPLLLRFAYRYFSAKYADSKYATAMNCVFNAVEYVNQTFVDTLKQHGNFDEQAQIDAMNKAKDAALEIMDASTRYWLEKSFVDLDEWLSIQIESAVKASKGVLSNGDH